MARVIQTIKLSKLDTLPGTSHCAADMDCDGAMVIVRDDGTRIVAVWVGANDDSYSIRYSYKIDATAHYILGTTWYSSSGETSQLENP